MHIDVDIKKASYGKKEVLRNLSFSLDGGSLTAVIGRNGSGKSTLVSILAGLMPYEGKVLLGCQELKSYDRISLARLLSFMPQDIRRPHITVERLVSYGRHPYLPFGSRLSEEDIHFINRAIESASLADIKDGFLDRVSGGELRRAYFGMMLAQNTDLVLLDEATAFMDADFERRFVEMQKDLSKTRTVISVMHNLSLAISVADNILLLDGGEQKFFGKTSELLKTDIIECVFSVERCESEGRIFFV